VVEYEYRAIVTREGRYWLADFPDCPGCQTFATSRRALKAAAHEALEGWIESHVKLGELPAVATSKRKRALPKRGEIWNVAIDPMLVLSLKLISARQRLGLTQAALAKRVGITQQQIAKLESSTLANPSIKTLAKVAAALDADVRIELVPRVAAGA
jgi:DNA-binding XRE family transcriptional regulator/predicted RNase H-like HicB family nuclease